MSRAILIADDHPLFRQALALAVEGVAADARLVEAGTLAEAQAAASGTQGLCLILLDLKMPGAMGCSGIALLHAERPDVPILVVSSADDAGVVERAIHFGAVGFLSKNQPLDAMERAIAAALAGEIMAPPPRTETDDMAGRIATLSPMQLRVLIGVLQGQLNKQIAHDLGISEATVKAHMTLVLKKLGVANRTQASLALRALEIDADDLNPGGPE